MSDTTSKAAEVEVTVKTRDAEGNMVERLTTNSKLTRNSTNLNPGEKQEDCIYLSITPQASGANFDNPTISVNCSCKLTKADAG